MIQPETHSGEYSSTVAVGSLNAFGRAIYWDIVQCTSKPSVAGPGILPKVQTHIVRVTEW